MNDPASSVLAHFGKEVRLARHEAGVSREELATAATCSASLVAEVEQGKRVPPRELATATDEKCGGGGRFLRLWPLTLKYAYPVWFRKYVELEAQATAIGLFQPVLVPGLVQTADYARAVLRTSRPLNLDDAVTARVARQAILDRPERAPRLWLILDESVLHRVVGDAKVMRGQLERLYELATTPPNVVQVLPSEDPYHGWSSAFGVLAFADGAPVVHVDGFPTGYVVADASQVAEATNAYDLLRALALSPDASAARIEKIVKGYE